MKTIILISFFAFFYESLNNDEEYPSPYDFKKVEIYCEPVTSTYEKTLNSKEFLEAKYMGGTQIVVRDPWLYDSLKNRVNYIVKNEKMLEDWVDVRVVVILKNDNSNLYDTLGFYNNKLLEVNGKIYVHHKNLFELIKLYLPYYHTILINRIDSLRQARK